MDYRLNPDEIEAIVQYVGLFGQVSLYSSLANLFTGLAPSEAIRLNMTPAHIARWGWKKYNKFIVNYDGIMKLMSLYEKIVSAAIKTKQNISYNTVRLCSRKQIVLGKSINHSFLSTSQNSVKELIELGYGNCPELAIIHFEISKEAFVLLMSILGGVYPKPKEGEILILPGMVMDVSLDFEHEYEYVGMDGKRVACYDAKVFGPDYSAIEGITVEEIITTQEFVVNTQVLEEIRDFVKALNESEIMPNPPPIYNEWVLAYKKMLMYVVYRTWKNLK